MRRSQWPVATYKRRFQPMERVSLVALRMHTDGGWGTLFIQTAVLKFRNCGLLVLKHCGLRSEQVDVYHGLRDGGCPVALSPKRTSARSVIGSIVAFLPLETWPPSHECEDHRRSLWRCRCKGHQLAVISTVMRLGSKFNPSAPAPSAQR